MIDPKYFVVRMDKSGKITETIQVLKDDKDQILEIAHSGVGCINLIAKVESQVDRINVPPTEVAEEAIKVLSEIIKSRKRSSSPQCLPMGNYRQLVGLVEQYDRAQQIAKADKMVAIAQLDGESQ